MSAGTPPLPLSGIRVLDLTNVLAGPYAGYQLALMGADVVKVELPGSGDLARRLGASAELNDERLGASFLAQNGGKRSVAVNLKAPQGRDVLRRLAAESGVLEAVAEDRCRYVTAPDDWDWLAGVLAAVDEPYVVENPPELARATRRLADRARRAADATGVTRHKPPYAANSDRSQQ